MVLGNVAKQVIFASQLISIDYIIEFRVSLPCQNKIKATESSYETGLLRLEKLSDKVP